jgi:hypothetical protein
MDPVEINQTFAFYSNILYNSESPNNLTDQTSFLDGLEFTSISENATLDLDKELNGVEISDAIFNMKGGKAAGPDGLPIDIY